MKRLGTSSSLLVDRLSQLGWVLTSAVFGERHRREMSCRQSFTGQEA
jgi:hypothetical protein